MSMAASNENSSDSPAGTAAGAREVRVSGRSRSMRRSLLIGCLVAASALGAALVIRDRLLPRSSTPALLRQARRAAEAGDFPAAARLLDELLARDPANSQALLYRGQMALDLGNERLAAACWSKVPDVPFQEGATARFLEGTQAFNAHRARLAERLFLRSTRLNPRYAQPRERLIVLYLAQLRNSDLQRELNAVRAVRPWTLTELVASLGTMGRIFPIADRTRLLKKFVAADAGDVDSALALAECLLADDRPKEALEVLDKARADNPKDLRLRSRIAEIELQQDGLERAAAVLGNLAPQEEAPAGFWRARGALLAATGEWQAAAGALKRAAGLEPDHQPGLYALGRALEHDGRQEEALPVLKRARLMEQVILQSWRIASVDTSRTKFLASVLIEIARLLMELDRFAEAKLWLEQALAWDPDDPRALARYAVASRGARASAMRPEEPPRRAGQAVSSPPENAGQGPAPRHAPKAAPGPRRDPVALSLPDRHVEAGLDFQYRNGAGGSKFLLETLGGGVAAFDFDADGWPDLYFTQGRPLPVVAGGDEWPDRLFRNLGGTFGDVTASAGLGDMQYSQGSAAADFDNDGFVDLAVANFGTNVLYHNNGDGTFRDVTLQSGISGEHWSSSLAFADLDRDGDLDLYVVTYVLDPYQVCHNKPDRVATCSPLNFPAEQDVLYLNRGDGSFVDVSSDAGILADDGKGLGIIVADFDDDGWPDIYIANDGTPNFLFHNRTSGRGETLRFVERGLASGAAVSGSGVSQAGMGIACADLDGDLRLDLYVTNFYQESGTLYLNQRNLLFVDATRAAQLDVPTRPNLGFGTQAIDLDLDGRCELFVANGHIDDFRFRGEPWKMKPQLFYNLGGARFADVSAGSGDYFQGEYLGRGVARLDWDRDGLPELVVVHQDQPAALLHNESPSHGNWLILSLHGVESNRDAIGARIMLTCGGVSRVHEICGGDGFLATNERRVILGLGLAPRIDILSIRWPSGKTDAWSDLPANSHFTLIEGLSLIPH
jgi:tetratricopeptide (TPR) repeat protein